MSKPMDLRRFRHHILHLEGGKQKDYSRRRAFNLAKKSAAIPSKYLPPELAPEDYDRQKANIERRREMYKKQQYIGAPKLKSYRSKESKHIKKAKTMYGIESMDDLDTLSKVTGCSKPSMERILKKGRGAFYSSGSRPNQTAESWAKARLASSVTGGKAAKYDFKHLEEGGCNEKVLSMAQKWMKGGDEFYPWLSYEQAHAYEAQAAAENEVSKVARSAGGFMRVYQEHPSPEEMERTMYSKNVSWATRRRNFIKRHLTQYLKNPTLRRWLAMIMWGYKHDQLH